MHRLAFPFALLIIAGCKSDASSAIPTPTQVFDMVAGQQQPFTDALFGEASLPGSEISWRSSNPAAATVDQNGIATGVHTGVAVVTGITENRSASVSITVHQGGMVNADSGVIFSDDRTFSVTRFAGTFGVGAFTLTKLATPTLTGAIAGSAWGMNVGDFASGGPTVLATITYDPAEIPTGTNPLELQFRDLAGGVIGPNITNSTAHTITVATYSGGTQMTLVVEPIQIDSVHLAPPFIMHVGDHLTPDVKAFGRYVDGVGVDWHSSDPTIVAAAFDRDLQALRAGTVTITATMAGVTGTTTVTVTP